MNNIEIVIPKEVWINSYLSIARYYGGIRINGEEYSIVPPDGDLVARKWVGQDEAEKFNARLDANFQSKITEMKFHKNRKYERDQ